MSAQPTLFDEQQAQIARVTGRIGGAILAFCRLRLRAGRPEFVAQELRDFVADREVAAPASPDRILRALRRAGQLDYMIVNRRRSLYRVLRVA